MIALNIFSINKVKEEGSKTAFEVGPLPKGYGNTLGNILRRVLLSSIPGSAITGVKLDGVSHEYSTLAGVPQDILALLLSIKNIVVISKVDEPQILEIEVSAKDGETVEVKASDIKPNSNVEIINKDYVITKITGKNKFKAQFVVTNGIGYQMPNQDVRKELGMLPLDAHYSPVRLVQYDVVPTRVGQETELDQLNITIETNGSVPVIEALNTAANILNQMTEHLFKTSDDMMTGRVLRPISFTKPQTAVAAEEATEEKKELKTIDLNLSTRLTNALLRSGYEDLTDLEGMTEEELANIKGMGKKSLDELLKILKKNEIKVL